jgi:hypothetical protein
MGRGRPRKNPVINKPKKREVEEVIQPLESDAEFNKDEYNILEVPYPFPEKTTFRLFQGDLKSSILSYEKSFGKIDKEKGKIYWDQKTKYAGFVRL